MTDRQRFEERTATAALVDFFRERLLSVVGLILLGIGAVSLLGFDLAVPRSVKLIGFTTIAFVPVGWFLGSWITGILYNPSWTYLIDLDAAVREGALHRLPPEDFRELTITNEDGNPDAPYDITQLSQSLYVAKQVDLETLTCVGTWRGTLDDRELARSLRAVRECRGQLQDDAQKGFVLETSAFTIVRSAAREAALDVVEMFQSGTMPSGGSSINEAVDAALEESGFEETIETNLDQMTDSAELADESDESLPEDERRRANGAENPTETLEATDD